MNTRVVLQTNNDAGKRNKFWSNSHHTNKDARHCSLLQVYRQIWWMYQINSITAFTEWCFPVWTTSFLSQHRHQLTKYSEQSLSSGTYHTEISSLYRLHKQSLLPRFLPLCLPVARTPYGVQCKKRSISTTFAIVKERYMTWCIKLRIWYFQDLSLATPRWQITGNVWA